jgi:hypothetical protein
MRDQGRCCVRTSAARHTRSTISLIGLVGYSSQQPGPAPHPPLPTTTYLHVLVVQLGGLAQLRGSPPPVPGLLVHQRALHVALRHGAPHVLHASKGGQQLYAALQVRQCLRHVAQGAAGLAAPLPAIRVPSQAAAGWCVVRGAWCVVRGAWCVVRGAWCVVSDKW